MRTAMAEHGRHEDPLPRDARGLRGAGAPSRGSLDGREEQRKQGDASTSASCAPSGKRQARARERQGAIMAVSAMGSAAAQARTVQPGARSVVQRAIAAASR